MRLTQAQANEALKKLLPGVELVEDEATSEYDHDSFLSKVDENRSPVIRTLLQNELTNEITNRVTAKAGGTLRSELNRRTGIGLKELEGLKDSEAIEKALNFLSTSMSGTNEEQRKAAEAERASLLDKIKEAEESAKNIEAQWRSKYNERDMLDVLESSLKDIPLPETANRRDLTKFAIANLGDRVEFKYDEANRKVDMVNKLTGTTLLDKNEKQVVQFKELAQEFFTGLGLVQTDTRGKNAATETNRNGEDYGKSSNASFDGDGMAAAKAASAAMGG